MNELKRQTTYISVDIEAALIRGRQYIIEIGAVKLNPDGTTESFTQLIQPYKFKKLNHHIQKLTGIKTDDLLEAPSFKEAFYKFKRWCKQDYIFLTFGEFDRKVLEEEMTRNYLNRDFLYPIIDFQQKYMIANKVKEQPSLGGLMAQLELELDTQHRALADAESLLRIFQKVDGESMIEAQKTNQFLMLLTNFKQLETTYDLMVSSTYCHIEEGKIVVDKMNTIREALPFDVKDVERKNEEGETYTTQVTTIQPSKTAERFFHEIIANCDGRIIMTRSALRTISRILRLHQITMPKVEAMTLMHIFNQNEHIVGKFTIGEESIHCYESKIMRLINKFEGSIVEEFEKRYLLPEGIMEV